MYLLDRVAQSNRLAHRHPIEKLLFSLGLMSISLTLPPWPASLLVMATASCAAVLAAGIRPTVILRTMRVPLVFMALSGLTLALNINHVPSSGLSITVTKDSLLAAAMALSRAMAAFSCLIFLALTTPLPGLLDLLRRCGIPSPVVDTALLTYNMLFVLSATWQRMVTAQQSRLGYLSIGRSYRSLALLVTGLLGQALHRSRSLENGLASRGFHGRMHVLKDEQPFSFASIWLVLLVVGTVAALSLLLGR